MIEDLETLSVSFSADPIDGTALTRVGYSVACDDWDAFEEVGMYEWRASIAVELAHGTHTIAFENGDHDMCPWVDRLPFGELVVPTAALAEPLAVQVRGWAKLEDERIDFDWRFGAAVEKQPFTVSDARVEIERKPLPIAHLEPETIALAPGERTRPRTILPGLGTIEGPHDALVLRTREGIVPLTALSARIAALPGRPDWSRGLRLLGGPGGRLAVHTLRELSLHPARYDERAEVVQLPSCEVVRALTEVDGGHVAGGFTGWFDETGSAYACLVRYPPREVDGQTHYSNATIAIDLASGDVLGRLNAPIPRPEERWAWIGNELVGCSHSRALQVPLDAEPVQSLAWAHGDGRHSAWHPACGVMAVLLEARGPSFSDVSLFVADERRGARQIPLPLDTFGAQVAVLRDGRVLVAGDTLLLVDPETPTLTSLGRVDYVGSPMCLTEEGAQTWLWTHDPARFGIRIPDASGA